ncbi:discoidin domain-containing protein [Thomasclavelia saccharogumia]|uniref:discoidin domain-containing protein n=1 Tax=Thomasclavelia saccharogumia TaxID=341225 RepID=UPI0013765C31|nr:discoidin domain-containing protein [Thomasclavelia saccharogumia]
MKRTKVLKRFFCFMLSILVVTFLFPTKINAVQIINWARMEGVVATSDCADGDLTPDKAIDGEVTERKSRWSSKNIWTTDNPAEYNHTACHDHWLQLEFPGEVNIHSVKIYWELTNAEIYSIESSLDGENWETVKQFNETPDAVQTIEFDEVVSLKYLRLHTEKMDITDTVNPIHPYYQNVSLYEMEVYGEAPATKEINLSMMKNVVATSDCSTGTYAPELTIDGDASFKSKWSSENIWTTDNPAEYNHTACHDHWLQLEFPEVVKANSVTIRWEKANAEIYYLESSMDGENWETIRKFTEMPSPLPEGIDPVTAPETPVNQEIIFENTIQLKYIRLRTEKINIDGDVNIYYPYHQNIVIYEFEVYGDDPDFEISAVAADVEAPYIINNPDGTRKLSMPEVPEGYEIELMGADYEQVIGDDGTIYQTIEDKTITLGYVVKKEHRSVETSAFEIFVPASVSPLTNTPNAKPLVSPELAEWRGSVGNFEITENSQIILGDDCLYKTALEFSSDYEDITGRKLPIIKGKESDVKKGDFYLNISNEKNGLGKEGYFCKITNNVHLYGEDSTGVYWGTRSILQILKQNGTSIPQGEIRDYPKYEIRGFGIDVGRQTISLNMLKEIAKTMSWYKMNDLHIHLNDNEILGYSGKVDSVENALTAYSGFRLESDIQNSKGVKLTSEDMYYTKEDFKNFIQDSRGIGVNIVPEIDSPAHSLAFTKVFPEYAFTSDPSHVDQIDLSIPGAVDLMKSLYSEYIDGDDPVFDNETTVHIGMDEYFGNGEHYRQYGNTLIDLLGQRTVRTWGSLSYIKGATKINPENVQMNIWHTMWAKPNAMYDLGYGLINSQNGKLYIIPGGGWDYLDDERIYNEWTPNIFVDSQNSNITYEIPSYSKQMLGGSYTMWHDMSGNIDFGLSEYDSFDRFVKPLAVICEKLWSEGQDKTYDEIKSLSEILGLAPNSNPYNTVTSKTFTKLQYDFEDFDCKDSSGNDYNAITNNAEIVAGKRGNALDLTGNKTVTTPLNTIGPDSLISFWVKRNENSSDNEQILFETTTPYGKENSNEKFHEYQFKAVQKDTGKVGFSREYYDYSFDYTLPKGEWVYLTVECIQNMTKLYVNGELVDTLGNNSTQETYATFSFPLHQIGSKTKGFEGMIDKLTVTDGTSPKVADTTHLSVKLQEAKAIQPDNYSVDSFNNLQSVIVNAEKVLNDNAVDILQSDIDTQIEMLEKAIEGLVEKVDETNKSALQIAIEMAENADLEKVVPAVVEEFNEALANAKTVYDDVKATQEEVDNAFDRLANVMHMLQFFKGDKTALQKLVDQINGLETSKYIESTWNAMVPALDRANDVLANVNAMQEEVDEVYTELVKAFLDLRLKPNKDLLQELINKANGLNAASYSAKTWDVVANALEEAVNVLNDSEASQVQVDNAKDVLTKAIAGLQTVNTVKSSDTTTSVKTGDNGLIGIFASLSILSFAGLSLLRRKEQY